MQVVVSDAPKAPAPRRKRASKPKVKSGCSTCKVRRIKCDEEKPSCGNCLRSSRACSYPSKPSDFVQYRPLAPANHSTSSYSFSVIRPPNPSLFKSEEEARYFNLFREKTAITLSGYFSTDLWQKTVLQSCELNPAIRACVIAIGALDQTLDSTQSILTNEARDSNRFDVKLLNQGSAHHQFALRQYGRAVRQLRDSMSEKPPDMRYTLISCILTACFEALHGDVQSAITQVRNGLKLIRGYLPLGRQGIVSRLDSTDETHEIIQFFDRMDNDCVVTQDSEPIDLTAEIGPTTSDDSIKRMPAAFDSIPEAKAYFEFFLKEFLHWIAFQFAWASNQRDETKHRTVSSSQMPIMEQRNTYLECFTKWYQSFQPLLLSSSSREEKDQMGILALECRFRSLDASLRVNHFLGEMGYDEIDVKFKEIIGLAKRLVEYESTMNAAKFVTEGAIISSTYSVALKCRNRCLRRQAIAILESRPRREGVFDSSLQAKLARIQMEIEESGMVNGIIPEQARIRGIKTTCDVMKREGHMKYLKKDPDTGSFAYQHLDFTW